MEATWEVADGWFGGRGPRQADIWLTNTDMDDDTFGLVEIYDPGVDHRRPLLTDNLFQLHSSYVARVDPDTTHDGTGKLFIETDEKGEKDIAYFRFPAWAPACAVARVHLKLWQDGQVQGS